MQNKLLLSYIIITLFFALFILDFGVTGDVVSQSCCFPPDCPLEQQCEVVSSYTESPQSFGDNLGVLSLAVIGMGALLFLKIHRKR